MSGLPAPERALLEELGALLARVDPVPRHVDDAAKAILGWRRLDADLAALLSDSAHELEALAGTRSESGVRQLSFGEAPVELDLEVHAAADTVVVLGQLAPGRQARVVLHVLGATAVPTAVVADELGRFRFELAPGSTFRLTVEGHPDAAGATVVTDWVQA